MLAVYIHIPFCKQKCNYCDFNSYPRLVLDSKAYDGYVAALVSEIGLQSAKLGRVPVGTVYIGGGTPTLLEAAQIGEILNAVGSGFNVAPEAEITIEANPETVTVDKMCALHDAGINRVSIGFQSIDDTILALLGRKHSARQAITAFLAAREAGFDNINVDLIFGIPGQSLAGWALNLEQVVALNPEHISCYGLTVEPGTPLENEIERGKLDAPDEDVQADMMIYTIDSLFDSGYEHYEISNFAKPGKQCAHNLVYWNNDDYIGFGAGAHSKIAGKRFSNLKRPEEYIEASISGVIGAFIAEEIILSQQDRLSETIFLGLRKTQGVSIDETNSRHGCDVLEQYREDIDELLEQDLLEIRNGAMRLTSKGILLGNEVFSRFV